MADFAFIPKQIAKRLKALRKKKELHQTVVAKHGGVSTNTLGAWERGDFSDIKVSHLLPVCQLLGASIEEVVTGENVRARFEEEKMKAALVMVLNLYKDFLSTMTAEDLVDKIMSAYHADSKDDFISSLETAFKR